MSFVESIEEHTSSIDTDEQLTGTLLRQRAQMDESRPGYFYLTDLVNPQQAYWDHTGEKPEPPEELLERYVHGNEVGKKARLALADVEGFTDSEGLLDGAENGFPGVRGRIDFRYRNSLVELKTTRHQIESSEDIWFNTPHYIEQLLFYSALWTYDESKHYLIYHLGNGPDSIKVFEVTIQNQELIERTLRERIAVLEEALDARDPSILARCRYFDDNCHVHSEGICDCSKLSELELAPLRGSVQIELDLELQEIVQSAFEQAEDSPETVSSWDLETPRQWYGRQIGVRERDTWIPDDQWVPSALASAGLLPGSLESPLASQLEDPLPFSCSGMAVRRSETTPEGVEERWVPALIRTRDYESTPDPIRLRNQVMQVGCACAVGSVDTGVIIVELPNADEDVVVYRIEFDDLDGMLGKIRNRLASMRDAIDTNEVDLLPECPDWLQGSNCSDCLCDS